MQPFDLSGQTLRITVDVAPPEVVITLEGELDLACADLVRALTDVSIDQVETVKIDVTELSFCDSSGLGALLDLRAFFTTDHVAVQVLGAQPQLRRLCSVLGEDHCLAA